MEYRNELLEAWIGKPVVVALLKEPPLDDEHVDMMVDNPTFGRSEPLRSARHSYELVGYDGVGVTLRLLVPGARPHFVSWGAIIRIEQGLPEHEGFTGD